MRFLKESGCFNRQSLSECQTILTVELLMLAQAVLLWRTTGHAVFVLITVLAAGCAAGTVWFFRDPERKPPANDDVAVSPADGKIIRIESPVVDKECGHPVTRVAIFLRLWDVHVNRFPVSGQIETSICRPGRFYPAMVPKASSFNEQCVILLKTPQGRFKVRQIAGMIARRIVCHATAGDNAKAGIPYGMIKFGSLVELSLPLSYHIMVKEGQKVIAGETIIGKLERK